MDGNDTIRVSYTVNDSITKTFSLIETGLGFEYIAFDGFVVSLTTSFYTELRKVYQLDMTTENSHCSSDNALAISKGGYWNIAVGIKYAFTNLWRRKK